jgi:hypothetical protein
VSFRPEEARAYADAYFTVTADALDAMRREVGSGSLGGGRRAVPALSEWAADHATPAVVERVVASATAFIGTHGHLLSERIVWVPFLVRLARRDPTWAVAASGVLRAGARGEWQPVGGFDAFTHPLSNYRVIGFTPERVRGQALAWLAALLPALPASEHAGILADLTAATRDGAPEVRERIADGAGWAAHHGDERLRAVLTQHVLTPLCHDRAAAVALAAYRALHGEREDESAVDAAGAAAGIEIAGPERDAALQDTSPGAPATDTA